MCRRRQPVREIEGASHQAEVGDDLHDISEAANERDRDVQLWGSDCHLSDSQIRKYMVEAEKNNMPPEKTYLRFHQLEKWERKLDSRCTCKYESYSYVVAITEMCGLPLSALVIPVFAAYYRVKASAHEILAYCKFDTSKALKICQNFVVPDLLSDYEKHVVRCAVRGEKFDMLSVPDPSQRSRLLKDLLPQQTRSTIMDYYYKNKHSNFDFECRMDDLSPAEESDVPANGDAPNK